MQDHQLYSVTQLWRLLDKSDLTQREIADELGVSTATVSREINHSRRSENKEDTE